MFTGIIEELGVIKRFDIKGKSGLIEIRATEVLEGTKTGDSIAVNGICLTVTSLGKDSFTADVMAETVRRSSLKNAAAGDLVNLERAMAADGRFGGHIVSGHIDGTGTIVDMKREENAVWIKVKATHQILDLIVEKGSICIDGISLTVAAVTDSDFSVSVIPHTLDVTVLKNRKPGDTVNLENDIIGKYVQKIMNVGHREPSEGSKGITADMLEALR